jgi:hypothetical protein
MVRIALPEVDCAIVVLRCDMDFSCRAVWKSAFLGSNTVDCSNCLRNRRGTLFGVLKDFLSRNSCRRPVRTRYGRQVGRGRSPSTIVMKLRFTVNGQVSVASQLMSKPRGVIQKLGHSRSLLTSCSVGRQCNGQERRNN